MLRKIFIAFLLFVGVVGIVVSIHTVLAHGSMQDPISRIYACYLENPETPDTMPCRDALISGGSQAFYDWNEVNIRNAAGNHQALIPDGQLCSAGREKYAAFDDPRTDWARTMLPASGMYTFLFNAFVPHNQGYFDLYVTNNSYDFSEPLKWSDVELFARVVEPPVVDGNYVMTVELPAGRSGHHVIYAIWQRNDSPEAFYSCSDVWFGSAPTPTPTAVPACVSPVWNSAPVYQMGERVSHNGREWLAKWSNAGTEPSTAGATNAWQIEGYCQPGGGPTVTPPPVTPTNTPPSTATAGPPTNTPAPGGACSVNYAVINQWSGYFQANVSITNNGTAPIAGWQLGWTHAPGQQVTSAWNATVVQTGSAVTASNPASHWNGTIGANGGSVMFGFTSTVNGSVVIPTNFTLNGVGCNGDTPPTPTSPPPTTTATGQPPTATTTAVPPTATPTSQPPTPTATAAPPTSTPPPGSTCTVNYSVGNDWGTGFIANVTIANNSGTAVNGWQLDWTFAGNQTITNLWNGLLSQSGQAVSVDNAPWNGTIPANSSVSFGFQAAYSGSNPAPTTFVLNGQTCN